MPGSDMPAFSCTSTAGLRPLTLCITTLFVQLCVSSTISLSIPFTIGRIIDLFSGTAPAGLPVSVPVAAAALVGIFALGAAANFGRTVLMVSVFFSSIRRREDGADGKCVEQRISGQRIVARLRESAYTNVLRQDIGWFDIQGTNVKQQSTSDATDIAPLSTLPSPSKAPTPSIIKVDTPKSAVEPLAVTSATAIVKESGVRSTGDIISRLGSDASIVGDSLTRELSEGLRALVTATVGVGAMLYISTKLTFVMLLIVPPISIAAVFYGRFLKTLSRQTQKSVGEMVAVSEERLGSIRTVHAFNGVEPVETVRFKEKVDKIFALAKKEAWASGCALFLSVFRSTPADHVFAQCFTEEQDWLEMLPCCHC